ncbi:MAG: nucleoside-diphosphate kinase [Chthoniobacterales bacterium]
MSHQLTYVLITPLSLHKARTGGILARLLSRSGLDLVGGRFFSFTEESSQELAISLESHELTAAYLRGLGQIDSKIGSLSRPLNHVLVLLFSGVNAIKVISEIVGDDESMSGRGETLRDTYGDHALVHEEEENIPELFYFEPGAIAPSNEEEAAAGLSVLAKYSDAEGGILDATKSFPAGVSLEKTLVLIKPDNFLFPNTRPGGIIDLFARTGLALVGLKVHHMSVAQAMEFYGPVLDVLVAKLPDGRTHWESIIAFMSGKRPSECAQEELSQPGSQQIVALIYQGPDAVQKIRNVLGPTNPSSAPHGTIRKEFGHDIMINAAHASDALESVARETGIINIEENNFKSIIQAS